MCTYIPGVQPQREKETYAEPPPICTSTRADVSKVREGGREGRGGCVALCTGSQNTRVLTLSAPLWTHCQVSACATSLKEVAATEEGGGAGSRRGEDGGGEGAKKRGSRGEEGAGWAKTERRKGGGVLQGTRGSVF